MADKAKHYGASDIDLDDMHKVPGPEEAPETKEVLVKELIEEDRGKIGDDLAGKRKKKEKTEEEGGMEEGEEEEAPESVERIKASEEKAEPAAPAEPAEPATPATPPAEPSAAPTPSIEKDNIQKLSEAIKGDKFLRTVFFSSNPTKKLKKEGFNIPNRNQLQKIVDEILKTSEKHKEAEKKGYTLAKSLTVAALDQHGFTPETLSDFSDFLQKRLKERVEASEGSEKPAAPPAAPTTPSPAPTPAPAPEPTPTPAAPAPTPAPTPASTPAPTPKTEPKVEPKVEPKEKKITVTEEHKKAAQVIDELGKVSAAEIGKRLNVGTKRAYEILSELESMGFLQDGKINQDKLRKLLPAGPKEEHKKAAQVIDELGKISASEIGKRLNVGTKRAYEILSELESMGFIEDGKINQDKLRKLLPAGPKTAAKESSEQASERLLKELKDNPKFKELIRLLRMFKLNPRQARELDAKNYERAMKELFGTTDIQQVKRRILEGAGENLRDFLNRNIFVRDGELGEVDESRVVQNLVEVAGSELTTDRAQEIINLIVKQMKGESSEEKAPDTEPSPSASTAVAATEEVKVNVEEATDESVSSEESADTVDAPKSTDVPDEAVDPASEKEAIASLKQYMHRLTEGQAALADLKKRLDSLFEILEADSSELSEADKEYFETIQQTLRAVLLSELPAAIEGISSCKSASELLKNLKSLDLRAQKKAMKTISAKLVGDEELSEIIGDYYRITGKSATDFSEKKEATPEPEAVLGPEATPAPEAASEKIPVPRNLSVIMDAVAKGDEKKKAKLLEFWDVYNDKTKLPDATINDRVKELMKKAVKHSTSPTPSKAKKKLEEALEIEEGNASAGTPSTPPPGPSTPSSGSSSGSSGAPSGAPSGAASSPPPAPSAGPSASAGPSSGPTASAQTNVNTNAQAPTIDAYQSKELQTTAINNFLIKMGFPADNRTPVVMAIRGVLSIHATSPAILKALEAFLKKAEFEDDVDKLIRKFPTAEALQNRNTQLVGEMAALSAQIDGHRKQLRKLPQSDTAGIKRIAEAIGKLEATKEKLSDEKIDIKKALERQKEDVNREEEAYSQTPERLLAMINIHFAKLNDPKHKDPEYLVIAKQTQDQIEAARQKEMGKLNWVANRLLPWNYLKPMLPGTLLAICEKDEILKKIDAEKVKKLAEAWDNSEKVHTWITDLPGSQQEKMTVTIPRLIAHLEIVTNTGRIANINSFSLNRARELLKNLRKEVHEYSIEHAKNSKVKGSVGRMGAYFEQFNTIKANTKADKDIVAKNSRNKMLRNIGIIGGTTAGVVSIGGLALPGIIGASAASLAGITLGSSFRVEDAETKALLRRTSVRVLAAGGLGALALATGPVAAVALGLGSLTSVFTPEIFKRRAEIASASVRGGKRAAPYAGRAALWSGRFGGMLLFSLGIGIFSKRYRQFWGFSK